MNALGALLLTALGALGHRPCLPEELAGTTVAAPETSAPAPAPVAPAPPPIPPPLSQHERTRYRIEYGPLTVGELRVAIGGAVPGSTAVRAGGRGEGAVLGLGRMSNNIATDFDLARLDSRRWVNAREDDARALSDRGEQRTPGQVTGTRQRTRPRVTQQTMQATFASPLLDPLAFLLRLRAAPPAPGAPQTLYVLDGQALWRVTIKNAGPSSLPEGSVSVPTFRLQAQADPLRWDGTVDTAGERVPRSLAIWLSADANHVPLRVEMPLGPSAIVVALTEIDRRPI